MVICTDQGERMEGSFVETAYTNEQVTDAIEAERKLGWHLAECAFFGSDPVSMGNSTLPPNGKSAVEKRNSHLLLDDRKLWVAQAVLDAFDLKTIRAKSLSNLTRWRSKGTWGPVYDEWWEIMTSGLDAVLVRIMTSQDDESNRLRQSPPYTGLLSQETLRRIRILYCAACAENDELEDE